MCTYKGIVLISSECKWYPTNAIITTCPIYQIHVTPEYQRVVVIITSKANKEIIRRGRETQTIQARELMQQPATDCKLYQQVTPRV